MYAASLVITGCYATFWIMELALYSFHILLCLNISHFSPTDTCFRACTACVRILDPAGSGGFEAEKEKGVTSESWAGSSCDVIVGGPSLTLTVDDEELYSSGDESRLGTTDASCKTKKYS
ncbi:hypothetical protein Peur_032886 [Populus x canadensis]